MLVVSNVYLLPKGISSAGRFVWRESLLLPLMAFGCSWPRKDASLGFLFLLGQAKRKSPSGGEEEKLNLYFLTWFNYNVSLQFAAIMRAQNILSILRLI